jgi:hypothetical protein
LIYNDKISSTIDGNILSIYMVFLVQVHLLRCYAQQENF